MIGLLTKYADPPALQELGLVESMAVFSLDKQFRYQIFSLDSSQNAT